MNIIEAKNHIDTTKKLIKSNIIRKKIDVLIEKKDCMNIIQESRKIKISLAMIVKNQDQNIEEVIDKIKKLNLDEYVVVDTGSTDNTVKLLKKLKFISLYQMNWIENYALMRNMAAEFTNSNWILTMDSDEIMITEHIDLRLLVYLLEKVSNSPFSINFEQHSIQKPSYENPARIYNKKFSKYFGLIHEELRNTLNEPIGGVFTSVQIENRGSSNEQVKKFSKDERYTILLKKMMKIEPSNPRWFTLLPVNANQTLFEENGESYEKYLQKYLFVDGIYQLEDNNLLKGTYTVSLLEKYISYLILEGKQEKARSLAEFSLALYPLDTYFMFYIMSIQIESLKTKAKKILKENLDRYLSVDKQRSYDYSHNDTQLLETGLAELNVLSGNFTFGVEIMKQVSDERAHQIWCYWSNLDSN